MNVTRRELIRLGAGATAAGLTGPWTALLASDADLITTTVPSSGIALPAVGVGTNRYRGAVGSADMAPLRKTLETFFRFGGRVIDTSPNYGNSEEVLGALLNEAGLRESAFMATKVDREDSDAGVARMKSSVDRLGEPIDLMQVHNLRGTEVQLETMFEWKAAGRLGHVGITTHRVEQHAEMEAMMRKYPLDFIQVNYSLADRAAAERVLPLAIDRGIAVLVNRPFGNGRLFDAVKGVELPGWAADIDAASWGQVFLKYIISHPAPTVPIPGTTKPHHAEDNMAAARGRLPDAALRHDMEAFFDALL
jgi:aryl-alcohol dehydrogenase-like predicted oxidoreductase